MNTIQWHRIIESLQDSGITQPQIAEACQCGQSSISDILRGNTVDPRSSIGLGLLRMAADAKISVRDPAWRALLRRSAP